MTTDWLTPTPRSPHWGSDTLGAMNLDRWPNLIGLDR
jgi:hypothetical protein